jgi:DnaJ-class molecular chaperone
MPLEPSEQPIPTLDAQTGEPPSAGENICSQCSGAGRLTDGAPCPRCDGTGKVLEGIGGG